MNTQGKMKVDFARFLTENKRMIPMGVCHGIDEYSALFEGACAFLESKGRDAEEHMHEEFLEAVEAIESTDTMHAIEEIGDAIFTMMRYAREQGHEFSLETVIHCSTMKLARRKSK